MSDLRRRSITIRHYNPETKQVELVAKLTTKPITRDRAIELAKHECPANACWEVK